MAIFNSKLLVYQRVHRKKKTQKWQRSSGKWRFTNKFTGTILVEKTISFEDSALGRAIWEEKTPIPRISVDICPHGCPLHVYFRPFLPC